MGLRFIVFIGLITIVLAQSSSPEWEQYKVEICKKHPTNLKDVKPFFSQNKLFIDKLLKNI